MIKQKTPNVQLAMRRNMLDNTTVITTVVDNFTEVSAPDNIFSGIVDAIVAGYVQENKEAIQTMLSTISAEDIAAKVTNRITNMVGQQYLNDILHGLGNKGAEKSAYS